MCLPPFTLGFVRGSYGWPMSINQERRLLDSLHCVAVRHITRNEATHCSYAACPERCPFSELQLPNMSEHAWLFISPNRRSPKSHAPVVSLKVTSTRIALTARQHELYLAHKDRHVPAAMLVIVWSLPFSISRRNPVQRPLGAFACKHITSK